MKQGQHRAPLVEGSDGYRYVLKLRTLDCPYVAAAEYVAALLAPHLRVATPPVRILRIEPTLCEVVALLGPDEAELASLLANQDGLVFGSRFVEPVQLYSEGQLTTPNPLSADSLLDLLAFDMLIDNNDRLQGGNPNLLVHSYSLLAIDHEEAVTGLQNDTGAIGILERAVSEVDEHVAGPLVPMNRLLLVSHAARVSGLSDEELAVVVAQVPECWWRSTCGPDFLHTWLMVRRQVVEERLLRISRSG